MDRRAFLRWLLIHSASLFSSSALLSCRKGLHAATGLPEKQTVAVGTETAVPTHQLDPTQHFNGSTLTRTKAYPDMVVTRGPDPESLVRSAVAALGGLSQFVGKGSDVIIKPNICVAYHSYEFAATTNPWVVGAVVKLAFEAGARSVRVMDYPFGGSSERAYRVSGIEDVVLEAGGSMEPIAHFKFQPVEILNPMDLGHCEIYDEVLNADVIINVPIAKHHSLARLTLGMKNLMGVIKDRPAMHVDLGRRLADLAKTVQPQLTIIDAVRILRAHGPTGGSLSDVQKLDTVIVSPDIVAADSYAATLFNLQPSDLSYVLAGTLSGLGRMDLEQMKIEEIYVEA